MAGFRHLRASEFIDLLEDGRLGPRRQAHLDGCASCQARAAAIAPLYEDVTDAEDTARSTAGSVDFEAIREGVRDALLSRAVKRAVRIQPWTPRIFSTGAARGLAFAVFVFVIGSGAYWHYRTDHRDIALRSAPDSRDPSDTSWVFDGVEAEVLEIEATAWAETDVFAALAELDGEEQDALREMLTLAMAEDAGSWSQSP